VKEVQQHGIDLGKVYFDLYKISGGSKLRVQYI
jgi:hypothetical protein